MTGAGREDQPEKAPKTPLWGSPKAEWGQPTPPPVRNGVAVVGLVLGLVGLLLSWTGAGGLLLGLGAVGAGVRAHREVRRGAADNPGLATVAIVLGVLAVAGGVVAIAVAT